MVVGSQARRQLYAPLSAWLQGTIV